MNPRHAKFIQAYLGDANGNASEAARLAGYSEHTAGQIGSRLLKHPIIEQAVGKALKKANLTTEARLEKLGQIADSTPKSVTAADVINANALILKVNGALKDKQQDSRISISIGFLGAPQPATAAIDVTPRETTSEPRNMPSQPRVALISAPGVVGCADSGERNE